MARTFEGEFVLADRTTSGKLNVYVVETETASEDGATKLTGWADIPNGIANRLAKGDGMAELRLNDGRRIHVKLGTMKAHKGSPLSQITFSKRVRPNTV
jgi:hypothetical protein